MKKEEIKKPENYKAGGRKAINNMVNNNIPQIMFMLALSVWLIAALIISVLDIFNGLQYPWLTSSFIFTSVIGLYLKGINVYKTKKLLPNVKITPGKVKLKFTKEKDRGKGCSKCGKNK